MNGRIAWVSAVIAAAALAPSVFAGVSAGEPAPAFTAPDQEGTPRSLSEFKGKFVVLEWFNNDCPFVRKHYDSGNMQRLQAESTDKGVAWLTMSSSAPGKQGHIASPEDARKLIERRGAHQTALLLDAAGDVGRSYGAKTTPHMFVVSPEGQVIYAGAIDNRASPDPADIQGSVNYVEQALGQAMAGEPVAVAQTDSYGCSVKY